MKPAWSVALAIVASCAGASALAQPCPDSGATLKQVRDAFNDMVKADRAPAAADCAASWVLSVPLEQSDLAEKSSNTVRFFFEAADAHRRAYEKRTLEKNEAAQSYLDREILMRQRFLDAAEGLPIPSNSELQAATAKHLAELANALAFRQKYFEVDAVLAGKSPTLVNASAVTVWLTALWSCARFDGKGTDLCISENREQCRDRVKTFLSSVDEMRERAFPPNARTSIDKLRALATGGCLK